MKLIRSARSPRPIKTIATICGESTLAVAALIALTRHDPRYRPVSAVAVKVALAVACAAVVATVPSLPSVVRMIVAAATYAALILGMRALPSELKAFMPSQWTGR